VSIRVRLLGRFEIYRDGVLLPVPAGRLRTLVAALALRPAHPVPIEEIAERLWCDDPPPGAATTIRGYVKRLRRVLDLPGERSAIFSSRQAYLLDVDPESVDVTAFRALLGAEPPREAISLWRGPALCDVSSESLHRDVVPALTEQYLDALERRIEHDLRVSQSTGVVVELRQLVSENPLREGFWAQLMRALWAAGRPAEAVATYHSCRAALAENLGVDPGIQLRELYHRILTESHAAATPVPHRTGKLGFS
jgi:DNA-binding SARP family transcriptional activator